MIFIYVPNLYFSDSVCETEFATNMTFKVVTSILNFYIPTSIITFLYVRIFFAIKSRSRDIVRFGAYTASGGSTVSNNGAKRSAKNNIAKKPSKCCSTNNVGRVGAISLKESRSGLYYSNQSTMEKSSFWYDTTLFASKAKNQHFLNYFA